MKKTIAALALAAMLLCSCAQNDDSSSQESSEAETAARTETTTTTTTTAASAEPAQADPEPEEPETTELYDTKPISEAYLTGDTSALDDFQLEIYNAAAALIDELITDDMSEVERELAIHDWMISTCHYDEQALGVLDIANKDSDNPHGFLIDHRGICSGYSTSFQLLMDMLGIECITIHSSAHGDEHAWNEVCLDGEWYFVDVTWDDPVPDKPGHALRHDYFNASESFLLVDSHEWDIEAFPHATGTKYSYANLIATETESVDALPQALEEQLKLHNDMQYFLLADPDEFGITEDMTRNHEMYTIGFSPEEGSWEAVLSDAYDERGYMPMFYYVEKTERGLVLEVYSMELDTYDDLF